MLPAAAFLYPWYRPYPVLWLNRSEIVLLFMQVFGNVMTEESEKRGNRKSLIAVAQHFKVNAVLVIFVG
jgi:hypothetical protein